MSAPACFENIFGLSRTDCECFTGTMPADAMVSASGIYLDELPGMDLKKLIDASSCETPGWKLMERAREEAVKQVKLDVSAGIQERTKWKRTPIPKAQIGDDSNSRGKIKLDKTYHGLTLLMAHHVGGNAMVNRIGAAFKFTGSVQVDVYEVDGDAPIASRTINAVANKTVWTDIVPIDLSMETDTRQNPWYFFVFTPSGGQEAINTRIATGCSCKLPAFDSRSSFESNVKQNGMAWTAWASARGFKGNDLTNKRSFSFTNETQGLLLDMSFSCDAQTVLCNGAPDYEKDPVAMSLAYASRYRAGIYLIDVLAVGSRVDRDALLGGEAVGKLRQDYSISYKRIVEEYLIPKLSDAPEEDNPNSNVNLYSDCFTCKTSDQPSVRSIRS